MSGYSEREPVPPVVKRAAIAFRLTGLVSFWTQVVLGVVSTIALIFTSLILGTRSTNVPANVPNAANGANPGTGFGLLLTGIGILALYIGIYWAFSYIRFSRKLSSPDAQVRPTRSSAIQMLRFGVLVSLAGMLATLLGGFSIVGTLVGKSLFQVGAFAFTAQPTQFIQGADVFAVQANLIVLLAHFIALIGSLWLIQIMSR